MRRGAPRLAHGPSGPGVLPARGVGAVRPSGTSGNVQGTAEKEMLQAEKEASQSEKILIKECKERINNCASEGSGVVIELFEFNDDNMANKHKSGHIFQATREGQLSVQPGRGSQKAYIKAKGMSKADARFWILDLEKQEEVDEMVARGFELKHNAILRPLLCVVSSQLSKIVVGFTCFDQTLPDWLADMSRKTTSRKRDTYLSDQEKDIIRSGWTAIEEIWEKGYTSDCLNQPRSYVMVGGRLKILQYAIRKRRQEETDPMVLKNQFADLLETHFAPLWADPEVGELILLMRNPRARTEHILGHPVLSSPVRRQVLYRTMCSRYMNPRQFRVLNRYVTVAPNWQMLAKKADPILSKMIDQGNYSHDVAGALLFGRIVSSHYIQWLKEENMEWYQSFKASDVDKLLKGCLSQLLCKRYALCCNVEYNSAT